MEKLCRVLRTIALAMMSGGSAAVVFSAVVLVKTATAQGVPVAEAAANNAPVFIQYSRIAMGSAFLLIFAELVGFAINKDKSKMSIWTYAASALAAITALIFAFGIVPPMETLLPSIRTVETAREQFHHLHEISRAVFGASILFAFVSLLLPIFSKPNGNPASSEA